MFFTEPSDAELRDLYAAPSPPAGAERPFVRANFIMTVDGHVTGRDGTSSSINNDADKRVFDVLRSLADTVVVGAGTVRAENYGRLEAGAASKAPDLVVVSNSGVLPDSVVDSPSHDGGVPRGRAFLATHAEAATDQPNVERLVAGAASVDVGELLGSLYASGSRSVLCEGGPHLLTSMLAAGLIDEIAVTTSPMIVGAMDGLHLITQPLEASLSWRGGAVIDSTVFALWRLT